MHSDHYGLSLLLRSELQKEKMMKRILAIGLLFPLLVACTAAPTADPTEVPTDEAMEMDESNGMDGMDEMDSEPTEKYAPLVHGYYEDGDLFFVHTEASDSGVAEMLTDMMGGPLVVLVPELAEAPEELLANVFVFTWMYANPLLELDGWRYVDLYLKPIWGEEVWSWKLFFARSTRCQSS